MTSPNACICMRVCVCACVLVCQCVRRCRKPDAEMKTDGTICLGFGDANGWHQRGLTSTRKGNGRRKRGMGKRGGCLPRGTGEIPLISSSLCAYPWLICSRGKNDCIHPFHYDHFIQMCMLCRFLELGKAKCFQYSI